VHLRRCGFLAAAFVDVGILITRRASTRLLQGFHNERLSRPAASWKRVTRAGSESVGNYSGNRIGITGSILDSRNSAETNRNEENHY